jgi:hypothetical protein
MNYLRKFDKEEIIEDLELSLKPGMSITCKAAFKTIGVKYGVSYTVMNMIFRKVMVQLLSDGRAVRDGNTYFIKKPPKKQI